MKKVIIASTVALSFMGMVNTASAAHGEVQFIGAVTATTCNLVPEVGGAVNNLVQLGTAGLTTAAPAVSFALKGDANCTALTATDTAEISWGGPFNAQGLRAQSGTATGAWVKLTAVNSKTANQDMTSALSTASFAGNLIISGADGAQFTATLNGGGTAGDYKSAAAFVVAYK